VLLRRPVGGVCGEGDSPVFHAGEQVGGFAGFGEVAFSDEDDVVVADRPEAVVEEPVGVLGMGDAVGEVVVARNAGSLTVVRKSGGESDEGKTMCYEF
jgi:hypothetical protein